MLLGLGERRQGLEQHPGNAQIGTGYTCFPSPFLVQTGFNEGLWAGFHGRESSATPWNHWILATDGDGSGKTRHGMHGGDSLDIEGEEKYGRRHQMRTHWMQPGERVGGGEASLDSGPPQSSTQEAFPSSWLAGWDPSLARASYPIFGVRPRWAGALPVAKTKRDLRSWRATDREFRGGIWPAPAWRRAAALAVWQCTGIASRRRLISAPADNVGFHGCPPPPPPPRVCSIRFRPCRLQLPALASCLLHLQPPLHPSIRLVPSVWAGRNRYVPRGKAVCCAVLSCPHQLDASHPSHPIPSHPRPTSSRLVHLEAAEWRAAVRHCMQSDYGIPTLP